AKKDLGNSTKSMPALDSASCVFSQPSELLSDKQGLLPAIYGVSIHAVVDYQKSRTKEPGPETGSARTQTLVYTYGKNYVVVVTSAIPDLSDKTIPLNCQSVAYFRVEPSTGRVLQYDGCVEAHVRTLPTFS